MNDLLVPVLQSIGHLCRSSISRPARFVAGLDSVDARPENLQYRYDYFIDNCSPRPRDMLDRILGGSVAVDGGQPHGEDISERNRSD